MAQRTRHPDLVAAPPDDGGDLGFFSRPDDASQVADPARAGGDVERHPPLSVDPTRTGHLGEHAPRARVGVAAGTLVLLAVTAILVALAMVVAGG